MDISQLKADFDEKITPGFDYGDAYGHLVALARTHGIGVLPDDVFMDVLRHIVSRAVQWEQRSSLEHFQQQLQTAPAAPLVDLAAAVKKLQGRGW